MFGMILNIVFTQMSNKVGIKIHKEEAVLAILSEYKQLRDQEVFNRIPLNTLIESKRKLALRAVNIIQGGEKHDIKRQGVCKADKDAFI
mmetsp:Transcript_13187/g.18864  ORF Transcript_13187/g.18864 Transcript_13187/m.18864 type:complete len:89 (+) Transcript_13187:1338-1604(+)